MVLNKATGLWGLINLNQYYTVITSYYLLVEHCTAAAARVGALACVHCGCSCRASTAAGATPTHMHAMRTLACWHCRLRRASKVLVRQRDRRDAARVALRADQPLQPVRHLLRPPPAALASAGHTPPLVRGVAAPCTYAYNLVLIT